jgi:hypothetical protein
VMHHRRRQGNLDVRRIVVAEGPTQIDIKE